MLSSGGQGGSKIRTQVHYNGLKSNNNKAYTVGSTHNIQPEKDDKRLLKNRNNANK